MKSISLLCTVLIILFIQNLQVANADSEDTGDILSFLIPSIAFGGTVLYEEDHQGSIEFIKVFVGSQLLTQGLKTAIHKRRPNEDCCESFPSGHSSRAFMGATFIHKRYGFKYSIPAYVAATYVGYSRIDADKHDASDVIAGALIGVLSSYYFVEPYNGFTLAPIAEEGVYGVKFNKKF